MKVNIDGNIIDIPYNPYDSQKITISTIIKALNEQKNALIESPTGTGKTLSIFCSVLNHKNATKIYICSRTHKQLEQMISHLKKTTYTPAMAILSSRTFTCINPQLKRISDKNLACRDLVKTNKCPYYNNKEKLAKKINYVHDIEELCKEGNKINGCPYYASTIICEKAQVIFAPYNYLIDPNIRKSMALSLKNSIVVIDEAHNIDDVCRSAGSCNINSQLLEILLAEMVGVLRKGECKIKNEIMEFVNFFKLINGFMKNLGGNPERLSSNPESLGSNPERLGSNLVDNKSGTKKEIIRKGDEIIKTLENIGITMEFINKLRKSINHLNSSTEVSLTFLQNMENMIFVIESIFKMSKSYCMYAIRKGLTTKKIITIDFELNFWLMDASLIFKPFSDSCNSVILLSGTLSPFENVKNELGVNFEYILSAPHVLDSKNLFVRRIVGNEFLGTYSNNNTTKYLKSILNVIIKVAENLKGGILVFVPSYLFIHNIKKIINICKRDNELENIMFLYEPKTGQSEFELTLKQYRKILNHHNKFKNSCNFNKENIENDIENNKKSTVLICVYRGKASEGVDFKDSLARAVIAVGIPYPNIKDKQVSLKKEYNEKYKSGSNWYEAQAFKAVNQAIGRVIRHSKDWGSIFFIDCRYKYQKYVKLLSKWAWGIEINKFEECENEFKRFVSDK